MNAVTDLKSDAFFTTVKLRTRQNMNWTNEELQPQCMSSYDSNSRGLLRRILRYKHSRSPRFTICVSFYNLQLSRRECSRYYSVWSTIKKECNSCKMVAPAHFISKRIILWNVDWSWWTRAMGCIFCWFKTNRLLHMGTFKSSRGEDGCQETRNAARILRHMG